MVDCLFCQIANGQRSSKKIYEDETCTAVLDINPANPGHVLLLPKKHAQDISQITENELGIMFMVGKGISNSLLRSLKVGGTNIFVANGSSAGQRATHVIIHIIPRKEKDGINLSAPAKNITEEDLSKMQEIMLLALKPIFKWSDDNIRSLVNQPGTSSSTSANENKESKGGMLEGGSKDSADRIKATHKPKAETGNDGAKSEPAGGFSEAKGTSSSVKSELDLVSKLFK